MGRREINILAWGSSLRVYVIGYDPWGACMGYYPRASFNVIYTEHKHYPVRSLDTLFSRTISNTYDTVCVFRMC